LREGRLQVKGGGCESKKLRCSRSQRNSGALKRQAELKA